MTPILSPFRDRCNVGGSTACLYSGIVSYMGRRGLTGNATRFLAGELLAQKQRNGWSLDDIEARTGVPRSTVDRALNGDHTLAVETLVQLCAGMGLDVVQLIRQAAQLS